MATTSNRDTYDNLYGIVASLMAKLVLSKKNLMEDLKENTHLNWILGQCQKITRSGGGAEGRGGTS